MKAKFITLTILFLWFNLISGNIFAGSTLIKLSFCSNDGKCLEFYSTAESVLDENECISIYKLFGTKLAEDLNTEIKPSFNLHNFVKTEKEVIENIIDTKAIFDEIIKETCHRK